MPENFIQGYPKNDGYFLSPRDQLWEMMNGHIVSQLIFVMAKLRLADFLKDGPKTADELAELLTINPQTLIRLFRGLIYNGLLVQTETEKFALTPLGEVLKSDHSESLNIRAIETGEVDYKIWEHLLQGVQTGDTPFNLAYGMGYFDYLKQNPELYDVFHTSMTTLSAENARAILEVYDFSDINTIVDLGGGHGILISAILKAYPEMQGVLFDEEAVTSVATKKIEGRGLAERCQVVTGDFFQEVPSGGDMYLLSWVIHDWNDEQTLKILSNCRRAMSTISKLLIIEELMPEQVTKPATFQKRDVTRRDLTMLALTGGTERTEKEYSNLLSKVGFQLNRIIPTKSFRSILECVPVVL